MTKAKSQDSIRVVVADDHPIFRDGLCRLLDAEEDIAVVGQARTGAECVALVEKLKPDVVLLDLKMPGPGGLEVLSELGGAKSRVLTIVLTASEDERDYVEAVRRGARGVILKQAATERLLEGIRKVHRGEMWIDPRVAAEVMRAVTRPAQEAAARNEQGLTARELEIISFVTQGFRNKEIADKLSISEQTVKNHLHNIFDKLGVSDRLELALHAIHHKIGKTP